MKPEERLNAGRLINRLGSRYLKWTAYGLVILLTIILQSLPRFLPQLLSAKPLLIIPVVVCIAMFEGPVDGAAAGVCGGILWDLFSDRLLGFNALILLILCCACGLMSQLLIRNNLLSTLMMTAATLFVQGILSWFFYDLLLDFENSLTALLYFTLPGIFYTLILTPPIYLAVYAVARILRNRE
ncbi:MAG: rod shape-determining protein MreD [Oscillospiraceae bacterium]|nr:rod shape-determining protein MreD [Oscillospiraceae bacterium]